MGKSSPLYEFNFSQIISVIIAKKENKGKFCLLLSLIFSGFQKGLSAGNLPFQQEDMANQSRVNY